jgi:precorrin-6A/cobalt-precorrin-6A reductase
MILVFGGTTEGKKVATLLNSEGLPFVYSTKTEIDFEASNNAVYRFGALSETQLKEFIVENKVTTIIDAAHPFAEVLHQTIDRTTQITNTPVLRFDRIYPNRTIDESVHYVDGYGEGLSLLQTKYNGKILLALTGVQSIPKLVSYWENKPAYFRILDRAASIDMALENNFPKSQLILGLPNKTVDAEVGVLKEKNIEILITKESGDSGALSVKIDAALEVNIPIIIIKKPVISSRFQLVYDTIELEKHLIDLSKLIFKNSERR